MFRAESWTDVLSILRGELTPRDRTGGWDEELRSKWLGFLEGHWLGSRFLPSDAAQLLRQFQVDGITSGPIVEALKNSKQGMPGVATTEAVATAVKEVGRRLRELSFKGSLPHLQRELDDATLHLVNLQRVNAGVTGREPGFTVNLNVVHGALRRAWGQSGHWRSLGPIRSSEDTGIATRLGVLALGHDHWWRPSTEQEGHAAAAEVVDLMESHGLPWLERLTSPENAIAWLFAHPANSVHLEVAAALVVELEHDDRRAEVERALRRWSRGAIGDNEPVLDWLLVHLKRSHSMTEPLLGRNPRKR